TGRPESPRIARHATKRRAPKLAPFAPLEIPATGATMWPVHPVVWFHPELKPRLPDSSGLTIENCRKLPAPDFLPLEVTPADQPHGPAEGCDPPLPDLRHRFPASGLAPSGWDPRVALPSTQPSVETNLDAAQHRVATVRERTQVSVAGGTPELPAVGERRGAPRRPNARKGRERNPPPP